MILRLSLILLFAFPLSAQCVMTEFLVEPQRPLYGEDVDVLLRGTCTQGVGPSNPRVRVDGNTIFIEMQPPAGGPLVPGIWGERVFLGRPLPGTYQLVVRDTHGEWERQTLVVRERPFSIAMNYGTAGTEVALHGVPSACVADPCPVVRFGGVAATNLRRVENGDVVVTVPGGVAPGLVDVTVTTSNQTLTLEDGFRYAPAAEEEDWERVLFPVTLAAKGAHGSDWYSSMVLYNHGPVTMATEPYIEASSDTPTLPIVAPLFPGAIGYYPPRTTDGGGFLYFPRGGASRYLAFGSHIVDQSRDLFDLGSELPVVRARDTASELVLPRVPVTAVYRARLRVYDFDSRERDVIVSIRPYGAQQRDFFVRTKANLRVCPTTPCLQMEPGFAVLDLNALGLPTGPAEIRIWSPQRDARLWAFVTVTNNETQRVTMHTPQDAEPRR